MAFTSDNPQPFEGGFSTGNRRKRIESPFYALTWSQAQQDYLDGILTPRGLIYCYFATNVGPGRETDVDVDQLCSDLGVGRATYYRAVGSLKARGRLNIRQGHMIVGMPEIIPQSGLSQLRDREYQIRELEYQIRDEQYQIRESEKFENELKPLQKEDFNPKPECTNNRSLNRSNKQRTEVPPIPPCSEDIDRRGVGTGSEDPLEADVERLSAFIQDNGIRPNKTIQTALAELLYRQGSAAAAQVVENAVSAVVEQLQLGNVRNPGGMLVAGLRRSFTANEAKRQARGQQPKDPPPNLTQLAIAIDQAVHRGDRNWALGRLRELWHDWPDEIEELMIMRKRDWRFRIDANGPREEGRQ